MFDEEDDQWETDPIEVHFRKMIDGIKVKKVGRVGTTREVKIYLSEDRRYIHWKSQLLGVKFGRENKAQILRFVRIQIGQTTPAFEFLANKEVKNSSMSLFYSTDEGEKSLDMVISEIEDFETVKTVFEALITKVQQENNNLSPDAIYLREMWMRADVDGDNCLDQSEIMKLLASMNVEMSKTASKMMFAKFDTDGNGTLDMQEFTLFLNKLRRRPELSDIWLSIILGENPDLIKKSSRDVSSVELKLHETISLDTFLQFWRTYQHETLTKREAISRIRNYLNGMSIHPNGVRISYGVFVYLICGADNDVFDPAKSVVYQDMGQPLSHYYIASSHNTYLEGDQLTSYSSVKRYIDDFLSGCRCVELDCWDGEDGEPIIYHGHTLTTKILFKDVVVAVKEYGFKTSPYPIILSIENHCDLTQQKRLADIFKEVLGDMLYIPPVWSNTDKYPSPEELKYKVLLKGKTIGAPHLVKHKESSPRPFDKAQSSRNLLNSVPQGIFENVKSIFGGASDQNNRKLSTQEVPNCDLSISNRSVENCGNNKNFEENKDCSEEFSDESQKVQPEEEESKKSLNGDENQTPQSPKSPPSSSKLGIFSNPFKNILGGNHTARKEEQINPTSPKGEENQIVDEKDNNDLSVHPELSSITTLAGTKIHDFNSQEDINSLPCGTCASFSESKVTKFMKSETKLSNWIIYNQSHFSRIYPAGTRVDSSNYDPCDSWACGAQLVALNYQTRDSSMMLNMGKFRQNGKSGYVLKPAYLLSNVANQTVAVINPMKVTIRIISASQLPKGKGVSKRDITDPFVNMSLEGFRWRTRTVFDNGLNPQWNEEKSFVVQNPDSAMLKFEIFDEDLTSTHFIAFCALPLSCARQGFRSCLLFDERGSREADYMFPSLLVHLKFENAANEQNN